MLALVLGFTDSVRRFALLLFAFADFRPQVRRGALIGNGQRLYFLTRAPEREFAETRAQKFGGAFGALVRRGVPEHDDNQMPFAARSAGDKIESRRACETRLHAVRALEAAER